MFNPHENFLSPDEPFDPDTIDSQNYPDFDPDQGFLCVLEAPSESSEQHYVDTNPALYDGPIPPEGLPLRRAMEIEPRLYEKVMISDENEGATNRPGILFPLCSPVYTHFVIPLNAQLFP